MGLYHSTSPFVGGLTPVHSCSEEIGALPTFYTVFWHHSLGMGVTSNPVSVATGKRVEGTAPAACKFGS